MAVLYSIVEYNLRSKTFNKILFFRKMSNVEYGLFLKKDEKLILLCEYNRIIEFRSENEKYVFEPKMKIRF